MGYNTEFFGVLKFKNDVSVSGLTYLENILQEDYRDHPEWHQYWKYFPENIVSYFNLRITVDRYGLEWDESEKSYSMIARIILLTHLMRERYPDFGLVGELWAKVECGEEYVISVDGLTVEVLLPNQTDVSRNPDDSIHTDQKYSFSVPTPLIFKESQ